MRYFIVTLAIILGAAIYLNRAYAHIYASIQNGNLRWPNTPAVFTINPPVKKSSGNFTYIALGDSLTAGVGTESDAESYPYRLALQIAEKKNVTVQLVNLGVPGAKAGDVLTNQIPALKKYHPDLITVLVGVNDIHDFVSANSYEAEMKEIATKLSGEAKHLAVLAIPYIGDKTLLLPPYRAYFDWQTRRYNAQLGLALADTPPSIIDLYSPTHESAISKAAYYSADGFHPSAKTYDYWASLIYDRLNF